MFEEVRVQVILESTTPDPLQVVEGAVVTTTPVGMLILITELAGIVVTVRALIV